MPYDIVENHPDCDEGEYGLELEETGELLGCHDTIQDAQAQIAQIESEEDTSTGVSELAENRRFKSLPHYTKEVDGRTVTGVFSVFGVRDAMGDVVREGAFKKTFKERGDKALHLWQHDFMSPPIAKIEDMREVGREGLPSEVKEEFPNATGGAQVKRRYLETPRGDEVLANIKADVPLQMSFGYDVLQKEEIDPEAEDAEDTDFDSPTTILKELRVHETSDVLWGANEATRAAKAAAASVPLATVLFQIEQHLAKGDVDPEHVERILSLLEKFGYLTTADGQQEKSDTNEDSEPKTTGGDQEAEPAEGSLTLREARDRLLELEIETLT